MALKYSLKTVEQTTKTQFSAQEGVCVKFNIAEEVPAVGLIWRRRAALMTDYCPQEKEGSGAMPHLQSQGALCSLGHSFEKAHNFNGSLSQLSCL